MKYGLWLSAILILICSNISFAEGLTPARAKEVNKAISKFESVIESRGNINDAEKDIINMGQDAIPNLGKLFKNRSKDKSVRHKAMELAAKLKNDKVTPLLVTVAEDKGDETPTRVAAITNIARLEIELKKDNKGVDKKYIKNLEQIFDDSSNDIRVRNSALGVYGRIGQNEALPALIKKLDDPEKEIRTNAVFGIGAVRTPEGEDTLIQGYQQAKGTFLESTYVHLFGFYKMKKAVPYLVQDLQEVKGNKKEDVAPLMGYFKALGEIGDNSAIPVLKKFTNLKDKDIDPGRPFAPLAIAEDAAVALAQLGDYESIPRVVKLIEVNGRIGTGKERRLRKLYREKTGQEVNY